MHEPEGSSLGQRQAADKQQEPPSARAHDTRRQTMVSLGMHIDDVIKVLLPDGWHDVREHTFDIAACDYMLLPPDTRVSFDKEDLITEYGFTFTDSEDGRRWPDQ
jgi:hypothetical protein